MANARYPGMGPGKHDTGPVVSKYGFRVGTAEDNTEIINTNGQLVAVNPSGGQDYFVDGNVSATGDGLSWKSPFKTLVEAITASNISIASTANRWWARRNRIFLCDDENVADLVAFPAKCDVIGVGSYDGNSQPRIAGNHAPVNASNYACRFINVWFLGKAAAAPIITLTSASSGIQFIDCTFWCNTVTPNTRAILATASPFMKVIGCRITGAFANDYINIATGEAGGTEIVGNVMQGGADNGVMIGAGTTATWPGLIKENFIQCADIVLDTQAVSVFNVVDNTMISGEALGGSSYVIDLTFAVGNRITGNDVSASVPIIPSA